MDVDSYFDFDSISSSSSPRTPLDSMYHPTIPDLHHHQRYDDKQQNQHVYGQQPSSASQAEFFGSRSNPPSFPSTPDFGAQSFGVPVTNSPHWPTSPPPSTTANDGQVSSSEMNGWSYVTNSPLVQRYSSTGSTHEASSAASPAAFDQQQQQQQQTSVPGAYPQPHQSPSYDEQQQQQQQQQQRAESDYFRRSSNASFTDTSAFSPSPHLANFQPHQQQLPPLPPPPQLQQPQQFYDPSAHAHHTHPTYFTDMRLSSSRSTSSSASSALSETHWSEPTYEVSPFVHHPPDDNLIAGGGVIGTPGSYTSEPLPLPALDPLSLHDYETYEQSQSQQAAQPFQQSQQSYFQHHGGSPYSTGNFTASSEHVDLNGNAVNGSPLVPAQQPQSRQGANFGGPGIAQQQASVQQHQHPYGNMGPSDSTTSLHSLHSQPSSVHSLHSQASHHSLHSQYQHQQPQPQQGSFPALSTLAGVLPSPPHPGLSNSAAPLGGGGMPGSTAGGGGVTGMLGGIPGHIAVMHTDDANSKETQFLRRRCFNCRTTDPPSWRRSTLNTGKIVCNKCGLYERTHMRPRPPRFDEMRTGSSSNGASSNAASASTGVVAKARKPNKTNMGLIVNGSVSGSPKGGVAKVRKDRERSADGSRRGSFSSVSATSDWDESATNSHAASASASTSPNPGNNGVPVPNYCYGPTGSHIYGHSLPYPQLPSHSQSLDSATVNAGNGSIRIPRAPVMGLNRQPGAGTTSSTNSRPTTSSGASGSGGSGGSEESNGSPFAAGIADTTAPPINGTSPLMPRKAATWSSGVGVGAMLVSPSSSTPPPPISATLGFSNGGDRSRRGSVVSLNAGGDVNA